MFPQERDETPGCLFNATPEDTLNFTTTPAAGSNPNTAVLSDIEAFADFIRMLAPPIPAPDTPSTVKGRAAFIKVGCVGMPYAFVYHGQDDCQRLLDRSRAPRFPIRP